MELPVKWEWLNEVFGDSEDFRVAISAYYMGLNILELAETIAAGKEEILVQDRVSLEAPICFHTMSWDVRRKAYRLLLNDVDQVKGIWRNLGIEDSKIEEYWGHWTRHTLQWLHSTHAIGFRDKIINERLFEDMK